MPADNRSVVWLPQGFSFLSGLPTPARKRRLLVPMQAFIDDSGAKGQGGYLTLAGFIGEAEVWAALSDEWAKELAAEPSLPYLSTSDAASLGEDFHGWLAWQRDAKVRRLLKIVNRFSLRLIYASIDLAAHAEVFPRLQHPRKGPAVRRLNTLSQQPYSFCFITICTAVLQDLTTRGLRERFELIFDEQVILAPRVKEWYPVHLQLLPPEDRAIMPIEPTFRDDREFMPLQVADFVAWMIRMEHCHEDHALRRIAKELVITPSPYCQKFDRQRLLEIAQSDLAEPLKDPENETR